MGEREGYTIRDVGRAVKKFIDLKDIQVSEEGMNVRLKSYFSTPQSMYGKKQIPGICIEGYMLGTPKGFQKEEKNYEINEDNEELIDVSTDNYIDVSYGYKIGFYVYYKEQCEYLEELFLRFLPEKFFINVLDAEEKKYSLDFKRDSGLQPLDEVDKDGRLVYRRDTTLVTSILLLESQVESLLRPFNGLRLNTSTDLASLEE